MKLKVFKIRKFNQGYTIIETMIAISLFIVIVMMGMGALLNANLLHEKSQSMNSIIDNMNFILEDISTNLRTGSNYRCLKGSDFSNITTRLSSNGQNCWGIAFEHQRDDQTGDPDNFNDQWVYFIGSDEAIWRTSQGPYTNPPFNSVKLTPDEIKINPAASFFNVSGAEPPPGNTQQPFVTIKLVGQITFKNVTTPFALRTAVSQRNVDLY